MLQQQWKTQDIMQVRKTKIDAKVNAKVRTNRTNGETV